MTLAELLVGVELADRRRRKERDRYVNGISGTIPSEPYDAEVARAHAYSCTFASPGDHAERTT